MSIQSNLQTLQDERELIQSEAVEHAAHGKVLESLAKDLCKPNEFERYLMFMGDLEKVVNLLLCLSTRLARIHNAMGKMDENTDAEEKVSARKDTVEFYIVISFKYILVLFPQLPRELK